MTIIELRNHTQYKVCMDKIKAYHPGFTFRMDWTQIPTAKGNAIKIVLKDAITAGYLESISFELSLEGAITAESYQRTEKEA